MSLDFKKAFDKTAHRYLFEVLESSGLSREYQLRLKRMYSKATSSIQVNGHVSSLLPIKSSIRQGCPLSMLLYTLCLNPLLYMIDEALTANRPTMTGHEIKVIAYADDVTIILHSMEEVDKVQEAMKCYKVATGAKINVSKSKLMALGTWDKSQNVMGIQYHEEIRILGIQMMMTTTKQSGLRSWSMVTSKIRAQACDAYYRTLSLDQRIMYVNTILLAKAWYITQVYPPPWDCIRQLCTTINWYIWRGAIFRVPMSTLYRRKQNRGWDLIHIEAKCNTLPIHRLQTQGQCDGTLTSAWLRRWHLLRPSQNPPNIAQIPELLEYLRVLATETAYIMPQGRIESAKTYRRRVYATIHTMLRGGDENGSNEN
jgi:hypothetical protein